MQPTTGSAGLSREFRRISHRIDRQSQPGPAVDFRHRPALNGSMSSVLSHTLAVVCSILVLLPPGWCCSVRRSSPAVLPQSADQPAAPCCCHQQQTQQGETAPNGPAEPTPSEKRCCCEPIPSTPSRMEKSSVDLTPATFQLPVEPELVAPERVQPNQLGLPGCSPALHVLQCVWRC